MPGKYEPRVKIRPGTHEGGELTPIGVPFLWQPIADPYAPTSQAPIGAATPNAERRGNALDSESCEEGA